MRRKSNQFPPWLRFKTFCGFIDDESCSIVCIWYNLKSHGGAQWPHCPSLPPGRLPVILTTASPLCEWLKRSHGESSSLKPEKQSSRVLHNSYSGSTSTQLKTKGRPKAWSWSRVGQQDNQPHRVRNALLWTGHAFFYFAKNKRNSANAYVVQLIPTLSVSQHVSLWQVSTSCPSLYSQIENNMVI